MLDGSVYEQLDTDLIMKGVYDWVYKLDGGILTAMPTKTVQGNGVKYNVDTTLPTGAWLDIGDVIPESSGSFTQRSAAVYELGKDVDVDKFAVARNSTQSPEAVEIKRQMRGLLSQWNEALIWGQTTTGSNTKQPKGLVRLLAEIESESTTDLDSGNNTQVVANHATSGALTLANLERVMDQVKMGCNGLIMSRQTRRKVNSLARSAGILMMTEKDRFNHNIEVYNGAKIFLNDHMDNNIPDGSSSILTIANHDRSTTYASGYDNTIILAMYLDEEGVCQIQLPGGSLHKEKPFPAPNKNANRHRFIAYTGFACFNKFALAGLIDIATDAET